MSGWSNTSDRRARLPKDWASRVAAVKTRAGGRCQKVLPSGARCPRVGSDCDHIEPGDDHSMTNLQLLCADHHQAKTIAERPYTGPRRKPKMPKRPEERHPGLRQGTMGSM